MRLKAATGMTRTIYRTASHMLVVFAIHRYKKTSPAQRIHVIMIQDLQSIRRLPKTHQQHLSMFTMILLTHDSVRTACHIVIGMFRCITEYTSQHWPWSIKHKASPDTIYITSLDDKSTSSIIP